MVAFGDNIVNAISEIFSRNWPCCHGNEDLRIEFLNNSDHPSLADKVQFCRVYKFWIKIFWDKSYLR